MLNNVEVECYFNCLTSTSRKRISNCGTEGISNLRIEEGYMQFDGLSSVEEVSKNCCVPWFEMLIV